MPIFKRRQICDFLFASLDDETLQMRCLLLKEQISFIEKLNSIILEMAKQPFY